VDGEDVALMHGEPVPARSDVGFSTISGECRGAGSRRFRVEGTEVFFDRGDLVHLETLGGVGCDE
jgi:hypothetical protein